MELRALCEKIQMPLSMAQRVYAAMELLELNVYQNPLRHLMDARTGMQGYGELTAALGDDPDGVNLLACQLHCACLCYEKYRKLGISEQIYFDTMGCFSRFVTECFYYKGAYLFDRGWWTWRQLSLSVFRLGQLEFELRLDGTVGIHIPTGADLSPACVDASIDLAKDFIAQHFPDYIQARFTCNSWLLSPALLHYLAPGSNIRAFRERFVVEREDPDARDFICWLFQRQADCPPEQLPELTSLQKRVKEHLLKGGKIGAAAGYLKFK